MDLKQKDHPPSLLDMLEQFNIVLKDANRLVPGVVLASVILFLISSSFLLTHLSVTLGITAVAIILVSILVFIRTSDYGQTFLTLIAGLFGLFSVSWTPNTSLAFMVTWIAFSFFLSQQ